MLKQGTYEFEDYRWVTGFGGTMSGAGTIGVKNSHVFMVVVGFEGMYGELLGLDTVESTTEGAADKAKEFSQTATNISNKGYIPMKLKYGK